MRTPAPGHLKYLLIVTMCALVFPACSGKEATPAEVLRSYAQLRSELDEDALGESIEKLEAFRQQNARYQIASIVSEDISTLRKKAKERLHIARELAREGKFERAEKILKDLMIHFSDTDEGKMAKQFVQFDFSVLRANRLMQDRRFEEAEQTIREAMKRELTQEQVLLAERMLDGISNAKISRAMSDFAQLQNASRQLQILLQMYYAENGKYPSRFSVDELQVGDSSVRNQIQQTLSAIEDYRVSGDGFSFVAVGKDGKNRIRVTQAEIRKLE